jgi:hypothetical protein
MVLPPELFLEWFYLVFGRRFLLGPTLGGFSPHDKGVGSRAFGVGSRQGVDASFQIVIGRAIVDMLFDKSFCAHFVFPSDRLYHVSRHVTSHLAWHLAWCQTGALHTAENALAIRNKIAMF